MSRLRLPVERIRSAIRLGASEIRDSGFNPEPEQVALAVERHRWAWKPERVRLLLIAESHVHTSADDLALRIRKDGLPVEAHHAPSEFVRLVYCLGYGETSLLNGKPHSRNAGTWQFWNVFGRIAGTGRQPTRKRENASARLAWKVNTLRCLRESGVWLIDSSLHGIYSPGAARVSSLLTVKLQRLWWDHYGSWLFDRFPCAHKCVIGKGTAETLKNIGVPCDNWIYQPQAGRSVSREGLERGWPALLEAARLI